MKCVEIKQKQCSKSFGKRAEIGTHWGDVDNDGKKTKKEKTAELIDTITLKCREKKEL